MDRNIEIDDLARLVRVYGLVLCYGSQGARLAFRYRLPADLRRQIRNRRRMLARMMESGDIRLCPVDAHKREWFYAGQGEYVCPICRRIDAQMGMWRVEKVS